MRTIDFVRRPAEPVLGWFILTLGCIALGAALVAARTWASEQEALEAADRARVAAMEAAQAREAKRRAAAARPQLTVDEQRLAKVSTRLRQPWLPTLRLVEAVTEAPVYLMSLSLDPSDGELRVEAEAPDFAAALNYAKSLAESGLVHSPQLLRHEQTREGIVKFSARADWSGWAKVSNAAGPAQ